MYHAFVQAKMDWERLADLAFKFGAVPRPPKLTLQRMIEPGRKDNLKSSSILWPVCEALGIRRETQYRVIFRREEIALLDAWRAIFAVDQPAATRLLEDVVARGDRAKRIEQDRAELVRGIALPLEQQPK